MRVEEEEIVALDAYEVVRGRWATAVASIELARTLSDMSPGICSPCDAHRLGKLQGRLERFPIHRRNAVDAEPDTNENQRWGELSILGRRDGEKAILVDICAIAVDVDL